MQAQKQTLGTIFAPTIRLLAPLFQRPYVWQRDANWQPLWEAVREAAEHRLTPAQQGRPYFLGAIVLSHVPSAGLGMPTWEIIDGQQRLTTLQVLFAVVRDVCTGAGAGDDASEIARWIANPSSAAPHADDRFKVWPTNVDRDDFRKVMTAGDPFTVYHRYTSLPFTNGQNMPAGFGANDDPAVRQHLLQWATFSREEYAAAHKLLSPTQKQEAATHINAMLPVTQRHLLAYVYWYLHAEVSEWLGLPTDPMFQKRIQALYYALDQGIELIVIQLGHIDDAQQIFETLNALGAPLLPADLVKNYLFRAAAHTGVDPQPLYDSYWKEFDDEKAFWRAKARQGRLTRPRIDLFLQHYLTLITGKDVLITDMFKIYHQWAQTEQEQQSKTPADLLQHFQRYANVYQQFEHYPTDSREGLFFHRLTQLDNTTVLPLLLEVVLRYGQPHQASQLRQILVDLKSYLVRRLVCGLSPKNYNRFFHEIVRALKAADDFSPEAIRTALLRSSANTPSWPDDDADTARWPSDAEFKQAWIETGFYNMLRQQRTRMILEALDQHQQSSLAGARIIFKKVTIEHLLPQSWQAHWPLPDGADLAQANSERKELLHTIGNLTLLSGTLNTRVSNGSWDAKHAHIRKHSMSNLNIQLPTVWDEAAIRHRTAALFKDAIVIWPYPAA